MGPGFTEVGRRLQVNRIGVLVSYRPRIVARISYGTGVGPTGSFVKQMLCAAIVFAAIGAAGNGDVTVRLIIKHPRQHGASDFVGCD